MKLWLIFYGAILLAASQAVAQSDADFSFAEGLASFYREEGDAAADSSTEATTSNGFYFIGFIEAGDEDWIAVDLTEGQSVRIQVLGAESEMGTLEDPRFILYNPQANEIGRYDDSNDSFEPDAVVTPEESGTHYIAVSAFGLSRTGTYSVMVSADGSASAVSSQPDSQPDTMQSDTGQSDSAAAEPAPAALNEADGLPSYSEQGDAASDPETQAIMSVNSDFFGTLDAGDEDWIAVELNMGEPVRIQVLGAESGMGTLEDPRFILYNPQANEIGRYDDSNDSFEPDAVVTPEENGTHYIAVSGFFGSTGTYSLVVTAAFSAGAASSPPDSAAVEPAPAALNEPDGLPSYSEQGDAANGPETQAIMSVNSDFFGTLDADDRDWIVVELSMGEPVEIKLLGADSGMGSLTDPRFTLYDPEGNELGEYDDSETSLEPSILFTPYMDGEHYIAVSEYDGSSGTYSLVVSTELFDQGYPADLLATRSTAASVTVGGSRSSIVDFTGDEDWIAVDLTAGQPVRIQVLGAESGEGTLFDPRFTLHDPTGGEVGPFDDSDDSLEPNEVIMPSQSGTYHIAVDGVLDSVGTYTVLVFSEAPAQPNSPSKPGVSDQLSDSSRPAGSANPDSSGQKDQQIRIFMSANGLTSYSEQGDAQAGVGSDAEMTIGSEFFGLIDPGDEDWIGVKLSAGEAVHIQVIGIASGMGGLSDPVLSLYHPVDGLLGRYDDSNESLEPETVFTPKQSDLYYLSVSGYEDTSGTYRVTLVPAL